jgi:hypothetical protein
MTGPPSASPGCGSTARPAHSPRRMPVSSSRRTRASSRRSSKAGPWHAQGPGVPDLFVSGGPTTRRVAAPSSRSIASRSGGVPGDSEARYSNCALNNCSMPPGVAMVRKRHGASDRFAMVCGSEVPDVELDRRPAGVIPPPICPLLRGEFPMPAEQGLRPDHERGPDAPRHRPARHRQQDPVETVESRALHLPL